MRWPRLAVQHHPAHAPEIYMRLLLLGLYLMASAALAQELAFSGAATEGELARVIPELARQALSQHKDESRDTYLANRFRLQLAAGEYAEAVATFEVWRGQHVFPPTQRFDRSILLEVYAKTKATAALEGTSFDAAFKKVFLEIFSRFDDQATLDAEWFLGTPLTVFQGRLDRALEQQKGRAAIAFPAALEIIGSYLAREASKSIEPALNAAIAADDTRRYAIDDVLIKTKEGATLSAIVARKKGVTERLPAALVFNIYTDLQWSLREAKVSASRGYVGVVADARGKRTSPDAIAPWEYEVRDTYGVIDWISKQSWSNGKVGMYGASYSGFAQWAAAKSLHPALKTIVPSSASQPGLGLPMQDNVFQNANYAWPFYVMNNKYVDAQTYNDATRWNALTQKWYASGRPYREIDALDGTPNPLLQKQLQHPSFDKYWQRMQPFRRDYAKLDIPVLSLTGYFDDANASAVDYLNEHYKYNPHANHYLLVGPYAHSEADRPTKSSVVSGYTLEPVAHFDGVELIYQWFDYVMRDGPRPVLLQDKINYQVMGANTWRHAPSIDQMSGERLTLYLTNTKVGDRYSLARTKPNIPGFLEQTVDFGDRTSQTSLYSRNTIENKLELNNGYVFIGEPFDTPVSVDGLITGELKASINKKDMDVTLAFYEFMPDGKFFRLSYYLGRASYANDMTKRRLLAPGKVVSIPFSHTPLISRQMSKGSRLVVLLTVNKNAWSQINYGTGKDVSDESIADAKEPLQVRWHNDSYVKIPIGR